MVYSRIREAFEGQLDTFLEASRRTILSGIVIASVAWIILVLSVLIALLVIGPSVENSADNPGIAWFQGKLTLITIVGILVVPVSIVAKKALRRIREGGHPAKEAGWLVSGLIVFVISSILIFFYSQYLDEIFKVVREFQTPLGGIAVIGITGLYAGLGVALFSSALKGLLTILIGIQEVNWQRFYNHLIQLLKQILTLGILKNIGRGLRAYYTYCAPHYTNLAWAWIYLMWVGVEHAFDAVRHEITE